MGVNKDGLIPISIITYRTNITKILYIIPQETTVVKLLLQWGENIQEEVEG